MSERGKEGVGECAIQYRREDRKGTNQPSSSPGTIHLSILNIPPPPQEPPPLTSTTTTTSPADCIAPLGHSCRGSSVQQSIAIARISVIIITTTPAQHRSFFLHLLLLLLLGPTTTLDPPAHLRGSRLPFRPGIANRRKQPR